MRLLPIGLAPDNILARGRFIGDSHSIIMKPVTTVLTHVAVLSLGLWVGSQFLGHGAAPASVGTQVPASVPASQAGGQPGAVAADTAKGKLSAKAMDKELMKLASLRLVEQFTRVAGLAERFDTREFEALYRSIRSGGRGNQASFILFQIVSERMLYENPAELKRVLGEEQFAMLQKEREAQDCAADPQKSREFLVRTLASKDSNSRQMMYGGGLFSVARAQPQVFIEVARGELAGGGKNADVMRDLIPHAIEALAANDPQAAMQVAESFKGEAFARQAMSAAVAGWLEKDWNAAELWARNNAKSGDAMLIEALARTSVFEEKAKANPQEMMAFLDAIGGSGHQSTYLQANVLGNWLVSDAKGASAWLAKQDASVASMALPHAISQFVERGEFKPEICTQLLETLPNGNGKAQAVSTLAQGWFEKDPASALAWMKNLPLGEIRSDAYERVGMDMAQSDPRKLLEYAKSNPDLVKGLSYVSYERAIEQGTDVAMDLYRLVGEKEFGNGTASLVSALAGKNLDDARQFVAGLQGQAAEQGQAALAAAIGRRDLKEGIAYVGTLPEKRAKEAMRSLVGAAYGMDRYGNTDGEGSVRPADPVAFLDSIPDKGLRDVARDTIAVQLANHDPAGAVAFLSQTQSSADSDALRQVAGNWARVDPVAAANWASDLAAGENRDRVVSAMLHGIASADPMSAIDWANSLGDEEQRLGGLSSVVWELRRKGNSIDAATRRAIEEKIASANIKDGERKELLNRLKGKADDDEDEK